MMIFQRMGVVMKQVSLRQVLLVAAIFTCAIGGSVEWSPNGGFLLSATSAQARVGRPLTPVSAAGVARRTTRRAVVGAPVVVAPACVRVVVNGVYVCR